MTEPAAPKPRAVRPKHAASLIVWRAGMGGVEVLMGVRNAAHRFMPSKLVFPGGRVDRLDHTAPVARPLTDATRGLLEAAAPPSLGCAIAAAAVRELFEETGLVLGGPIPPAARPRGAWSEFLATGFAPDLAPLEFLCRAVTPAFMPMRFNARFLVAPIEAVRGDIRGNGELEFLRFMRLDEARALDVAPVTRNVLEEFAAWLAMPAQTRGARRIPLYEPARDSARGRLRL